MAPSTNPRQKPQARLETLLSLRLDHLVPIFDQTVECRSCAAVRRQAARLAGKAIAVLIPDAALRAIDNSYSVNWFSSPGMPQRRSDRLSDLSNSSDNRQISSRCCRRAASSDEAVAAAGFDDRSKSQTIGHGFAQRNRYLINVPIDVGGPSLCGLPACTISVPLPTRSERSNSRAAAACRGKRRRTLRVFGALRRLQPLTMSSMIPTTTERTGPSLEPNTCRAPLPSSRTRTRSSAPAPTASAAMR